VHLRFGRIRQGALLDRLVGLIGNESLFIADGHHRFGASLDFFQENPETAPPFIMVYLTNLASSDLIVLPTHRLIRQDVRLEARITEAGSYFKIQPFTNVPSLLEALNKEDACSFGVCTDGTCALWTLGDIRKIEMHLPAGRSRLWKKLDVVVLHYFILPQLLNLKPEEQLFYGHDAASVLETARAYRGSVTFLLKTPDIRVIKDICSKHEILPPKTTYFFPKVPSGLVFARH